MLKSLMPNPATPRLLQIVDSLNAGGMENIMMRVCNRLQEKGWQVTVGCLSQGGPFALRLHPEVKLRIMQKPPGFSWKTARELGRWMRQDTFDVVHTHHLGGLIYAALGRGIRGFPRLVHSEHILWDQAELSWKRQWQRRLLYRACSCVFTVSEQQLSQMRELGHQHRWQTTLVNGVDLQQFKPATESKAALRQALGLDPEGLWLIKVARFGATKRHTTLIEAFERAHAAEPRLRLMLVGDGGAEKERVLQRMKESTAAHAMRWVGFQQDPSRHYQAADLLVVASSFEGLPNAVLEGMACGLPVLAHEACGVREVAKDGEHGWIGDFTTVSQLATALSQAAAVPAKQLESMATAASGHVQRHFSIETMLDRYERLYTAVAGKGSEA